MKRALVLVLAALLWLGAQGLKQSSAESRADWPKMSDSAFVLPASVIRFAPFRELLADLLWCRLLVYYGSNWGGEGDVGQTEEFLDAIIALDPRFKPVYEWAAYSVVFKTGKPTQEEFLSSIRYMERAIQEFPDDYKYYWIAGTRYYFDLWSPEEKVRNGYRERGADLIEQALDRPNVPPDLATTAASMRSKLGQHQRALDHLRRMILTTEDKAARARMLRRVRLANPDLADELSRAATQLEEAWRSNLPMVPIDFFIQLGPRPSPVIDFRQLATPHDLFGVETGAAETDTDAE